MKMMPPTPGSWPTPDRNDPFAEPDKNPLADFIDGDVLVLNPEGKITLAPEAITALHLRLGTGDWDINAGVIPANGDTTVQQGLDNVASNRFMAYKLPIAAVLEFQSQMDFSHSLNSQIDGLVPNHANGEGSETSAGVVTNSTLPFQLTVTDLSGNPIYAEERYEVYAVLEFISGLGYRTFLKYQDGINPPTSYLAPEELFVVLSYIVFSDKASNLPWNILIGEF